MLDTIYIVLFESLSIINIFSVAFIIGAVTILTVLSAQKHIDKSILSPIEKIFRIGLYMQIVYRAVDIASLYNLISNGEADLAQVSPVYSISLFLTIASLIILAVHHYRKLSASLSTFGQAAIWYTIVLLTNISSFQSLPMSTIVIMTVFSVSALLLAIDTVIKYKK